MRPWERRLRDLANLLHSSGQNYFSPDLFRQNTNQFLQTSRTVTFIIQKNKSTIPNFDVWYKENVLNAWSSDTIMTWAKNARNVVEKEGDLDMKSTLRVSVLFSYESAEDMTIEVSRLDLLKSSADQLMAMARRKLPPGIADAALIKIQRQWIANTLLDHELIYALTYAYSQLHKVCSTLARHLGLELDSTVPHPTSLDPATNDVAAVRYRKFSKPGLVRHSAVRIKRDERFKPSDALSRLKNDLLGEPKPSSLAEVVSWQAKMAELTFSEWKNHVPMLALYDEKWNHIDGISAAFTDQADKFIFWRNVADRAFYLRAFAMIWTSEVWLRDFKDHGGRPIRALPITGEQLHVVGIDAGENLESAVWTIDRSAGALAPTLIRLTGEDAKRALGKMFFAKPVIAAMKLARASK